MPWRDVGSARQGGGSALAPLRIYRHAVDGLASGRKPLLRSIDHGAPGVAHAYSRNDGHSAQQSREIEIGLAAACHEIQRILRLAGVSFCWVGVKQVGNIGPWCHREDQPDESAAKPAVQV